MHQTQHQGPALLSTLEKIRDGENCFGLATQLPTRVTSEPKVWDIAGGLSLLAVHSPKWPSALILHRDISVLYTIGALCHPCYKANVKLTRFMELEGGLNELKKKKWESTWLVLVYI